MSILSAIAAAALVAASVGCAEESPSAPGGGRQIGRDHGLPISSISLPPGFRIDVWASGINAARSLARGDRGTIFVGTRESPGNVRAIVDTDRDGFGDELFTIDSGLNMPNGVAFRDGDLYVAEVNRILRYDDIEGNLGSPPEPVVVTDRFPSDRTHGWKFIAFGPDGMLYVPVGAPCNACDRGDLYASITRMRPDGSGYEVFARGIRNTVGFDWHPETRELWFTDNGRDNIGASMAARGMIPAGSATAYTDSLPPDELDRAPRAGLHFGYPYIHGMAIRDPDFGAGKDPAEYVAPAANLGPHVAALGMRFYTGRMFPAEYRNAIFIAEHGSWNRSVPLGYRVMSVRLDGNGARTYEEFATGWLRGGNAWGRPVDVLVLPDGSLLISDDRAGAIYRITYGG